jgi:hypothetical protein
MSLYDPTVDGGARSTGYQWDDSDSSWPDNDPDIWPAQVSDAIGQTVGLDNFVGFISDDSPEPAEADNPYLVGPEWLYGRNTDTENNEWTGPDGSSPDPVPGGDLGDGPLAWIVQNPVKLIVLLGGIYLLSIIGPGLAETANTVGGEG